MKERIPTPSNDNEKQDVQVEGTNVVEFRKPGQEQLEHEKYGGAVQRQVNERYISRIDSGISGLEASFAKDRERILEIVDRLKEQHQEIPMTPEELELEKKWGEEGEEKSKLGTQLYPLQFPTTHKSSLSGNFTNDLSTEMRHRKEKDTKNRQQATLGVLGLGVVSTGAAVVGGTGIATAMALGGPATLAAGLGVYGGVRLVQAIRNRRYQKDATKYAIDQKLNAVES